MRFRCYQGFRIPEHRIVQGPCEPAMVPEAPPIPCAPTPTGMSSQRHSLKEERSAWLLMIDKRHGG